MKTLAIVFMLVLFSLSFLPSPSYCDNSMQDIDQLLSTWHKKSMETDSVECTIDYDCWIPKGKYQLEDGSYLPKSDYTFHGTTHMIADFRHGKFRIERDQEVLLVDIERFVRQKHLLLSDGVHAFEMTDDDLVQKAQGSSKSYQELNAKISPFNDLELPIVLSYEPFVGEHPSSPTKSDFSIGKLDSEKHNFVHDGNLLILTNGPVSGSRNSTRIWITPAPDFSITKWNIFQGDKIYRELDIKYVNKDGTLAPSSGTVYLFSTGDPSFPSYKKTYQVRDLIINGSYPDLLFTPSLMPGDFIGKRKNNDLEFYRLNKDKQEELWNRARPAVDPPTAWMYWVSAFFGLCFILLVLFCLLNKRTS